MLTILVIMHFVLTPILLTWSIILTGLYVFAEPGPDSLASDFSGIHQQTPLSNEPVIFAGGPSTTQELIDRVNRTWFPQLPALVSNLPYSMENSTAVEVDRIRWVFYGVTKMVNITAPWLATCRPVIRGVKALDIPGYCGNVECRISRIILAKETYQTTETFRLETTFSAGVNYRGFEASVSTTRERAWEKIWGRSTIEGTRYEWLLGPGQRCTPSMAHVELDCDLNIDTIYYDTFVHNLGGRLRLEHDNNRKGGRYFAEQWCTQFRVNENPLRIGQDWKWVLTNDRQRGRLWKRPTAEMNQYRINGSSIVRDMVIVSREQGRGGDWQEVMGCTRDTSRRRQYRVVVPAYTQHNILPGYIGCVAD